MALTIYTGGAGSGKTFALLSRIIQESMKHPEQQFYVIVPEQATMQTQKELVRLHPRHGILNIDVLSFNRLAYRVFHETGFQKEELLEEIGKTFLLEKIALEESGRLSYFGKTLTRPENLAEMKALISEFMLYGVTPQQLADCIQKEDGGERTPFDMKTDDIAVIYSRFLERMEGIYMTAEEVPDRLSTVIDKSKKVRGSVIALDGFTGFTPIQVRLIEKLIAMASDLYVTITADDASGLMHSSSDQDLFALSRETCRTIVNAAIRMNKPKINVIPVSSDRDRFCNSRELQHLEQHLFRRNAPVWKQPVQDIRILAAQNPREEIEEIARRISRLVREEGLQYREIAIITGDLTTYDNYVRQTFREWEIPYFLDEKRTILGNPLIEYLRAALEVCADQYSYSGMFRMLKSKMTDISEESIDHLENYVLGMGIRGRKKWETPFFGHYRGEDPAEVPQLEMIRRDIMALVSPLTEVFSRRGSTVREKTAALYEFCVRSHAEEKLKQAEKQYAEDGRNDLAKEYAQVYPYVISVFDKLVEVLGDERISQSDYRALLEAAFQEARVAIIPPGADRILVGDMERSRLQDIKVLFFAGVNEGIIPKPVSSGGLLSDQDRRKMQGKEISLKPTSREAIYIERFYLYLALTKASEKLYLSFSTSTSSGETIRPAYVIDVIRRLFPETGITVRESRLKEQVERKSTGMGLLAEGIGHLNDQKLQPEYLELFSCYRSDPEYAGRIQVLLQAAKYEKPEDQIGRATAAALYGRNLRNSASRLEEFCSCEFRHFLKYGLKLKERPEFVFSRMEMGNILHSALEKFAVSVKNSNDTWNRLYEDPVKRNEYAVRSVTEAVEEEGGEILRDSARNEYQIERMKRLMSKTVWALAYALSRGDFQVEDVEAAFLSPEELDVMQIDLPGGERMTLTGRIDRIDTCESDGRTLVKIIDYKSGNVKFDLAQIYYGLQMQLVVYLNAALEMLRRQGRQPYPAGIFYYQIQDPLVEYQPDAAAGELEQKALSQMKASGVVLDDREVQQHFDHRLCEDGVKSNVIPVAYTAKGQLHKTYSKTLSAEQFDSIERFVKRKVRKTAVCILNGDAEINPYQLSRKTACDYCPYHGICGFDRSIPGFEFRMLPEIKSTETVIQKMEDGDES